MAYTQNEKPNGFEAKATPVDADILGVGDSVDTFRTKGTTWAQVKAVLKTYLDGLYSTKTQIDTLTGGGTWGTITGSGTGPYTVSRGNYTSGTLEIEYGAAQLHQDGTDGFTETTPGSGTFTLDFTPTGGVKIKARYQYI